jgi:hypothetical protein
MSGVVALQQSLHFTALHGGQNVTPLAKACAPASLSRISDFRRCWVPRPVINAMAAMKCATSMHRETRTRAPDDDYDVARRECRGQ